MFNLATVLHLLLVCHPPTPAPPPRLDARDLQVTIQAHRVLAADEVLGPLNLGVRVHRGVATVWGEVPSRELSGRAAALLEEVKGVYEVRSDLVVRTGPTRIDTLRELLDGLAEGRLPTDAESPGPPAIHGPGSGLLGSVRGSEDRPAEVISPYPPLLPEVAPDRDEEPRDEFPPVVLAPPVPVEQPVPENSRPQARPVAERMPELSEVQSRLDGLRTSDRRYRELTIRAEGGYVTIEGRIDRREWLIELARAAAAVPGVTQVDVRKVRPVR